MIGGGIEKRGLFRYNRAMQIDKAAFTVFDVETTGLYPYLGDKICEIAAIRIDYKKKTKTKFHSLIDPGIPVSRGAFLVNGITEDMLEGQPKIHDTPRLYLFYKGKRSRSL